MRVEVGYVELLQGAATTSDDRERLIAEASERRRTPPARRQAAAPPERTTLLEAQDRDTVQAMRATEEHRAAPAGDSEDAGDDQPAAQPGPVRPRRTRPRATALEIVASVQHNPLKGSKRKLDTRLSLTIRFRVTSQQELPALMLVNVLFMWCRAPVLPVLWAKEVAVSV